MLIIDRRGHFRQTSALSEVGSPRASTPTALVQFLRSSLILCSVFFAVMSVYWFQGLQEGFPEESFWDPIIGFFMGFPLLFATGFAAPFGLPQVAYVFIGVAIDGLFWAFAGVSIHGVFRWLAQRTRFSDETRAA
jgi:hypothetical protein